MTTLDLQVAASADDAYELADGTGFTAVATQLFAVANSAAGTRASSGSRFTGVTIAPGSTIDVAYCPTHAVSTSVDDPNVNIVGNDVDDAANFTTEADVISRARTSASVQWTATGIGTGEVNSPSIVSIIQEIIDRAGWASGNAIVIIFDGRSDANTAFRTISADNVAPENALKLHIEYTAPAAGSILPFVAADMQNIADMKDMRG